MAPINDFRQQLFSHIPAARFSTLTCGHVVPREHMLVQTLGVGPGGSRMELKYEARKDVKLVRRCSHDGTERADR